MADNSKWFNIQSSSDYHYPGVFTSPNPQRMGFCSDIGTLPNYEPADPHFLYSDIQLGKGRPRGIRKALFDVNGQEEILNYRITPCRGVKLCSHTEGCEFVCATKDRRRCPDHPEESLKSSGLCPVEFVYLWPKNSLDRRMWITGLVRGGSNNADNLHNHPIHGPAKIPSKVDADIRRAMISNPHLKTSDIVVGIYFWS